MPPSTQYGSVWVVYTNGTHDYAPRIYGVYTGEGLANKRMEVLSKELPNVVDWKDTILRFRPGTYTVWVFMAEITVNKALEEEL